MTTAEEHRNRFAYRLTEVAFTVNPNKLKAEFLRLLEEEFGPPEEKA